MFRIVFTSTCPRTRIKVVDNGPWHPTRAAAERWIGYFLEQGHLARMTLESANYHALGR